MKNNCIIRLERTEEHRETETLVREAFWNVYRPGCLEHYVLNQLRNDEAFVPEETRNTRIAKVLDMDYRAIGQRILKDFIEYVEKVTDKAFEYVAAKKG